jgi:hypothetical protein
MRHAILVIGSQSQDALPVPELALTDNEAVRMSTWYANLKQSREARLLDDESSLFLQILFVPVLAYRIYALVHNTKLWSGKRPLILVRGRSLSSRVAAYAGTWGGGDVVKADSTDVAPLGPTRYLLTADGKLALRDGSAAK